MATLVSSCEKNHDVAPGQALAPPTEIDPAKVQWLPKTAQEKAFVANLEKVTNVVKELYKNPRHVSLVKASIYAKAYTDESILVRDLIYPDKSVLRYNQKFNELCKRKNLNLSDFSRDFWQVVNKTNDSAFKVFLSSLQTKSVASRGAVTTEDLQGGVSIYYPYSQVFEEVWYDDNGGGSAGPMTVVSAAADADEGWGYRPYTDGNGNIQYETVLVDDSYAENNPSQIIGVNGIEPYYAPPTTSNLVFPPGPPIQVPGLPRPVREVWISHLQCRRHWDKLISATGNGGGNEMIFTRGDGYLSLADGRAVGAFPIGQRDISRWHITHKKFHDFDALWDGDWEADNREQNIGLYEKDNRNEQTFKGSLKTKLSTGTDGEIGFEIKYKSDDRILTQFNVKEDVFFILNRTELDGGFYPVQQGWPIRSTSPDESFTLADKTRIP